LVYSARRRKATIRAGGKRNWFACWASFAGWRSIAGKARPKHRNQPANLGPSCWKGSEGSFVKHNPRAGCSRVELSRNNGHVARRQHPGA
jgi:hypothetical protein